MMADGYKRQKKNLSRTFHLSYLFLLITEFLVTTTQESAFILEKDNFKWNAGPWMKCQIEEEDSCTQKRKVDCRNGLDQRAPPTFCKPSDRPEDSRPCSPCPEACLLTAWTAWSECSATCSPAANRIRSREVLRPEVNQGDVCGELSQFEVCVELPDCGDDMVPIYTWRTGEWTSCRKIDSLISGECGLGQRTRSVACLDETGRNVPEDGCLYRNQGQTPADLEICSVPCDCVLSDWSEWSLCSQTCLDTLDPSNLGYQTRSREILRLPDKEGLPCAHVIEQRECVNGNQTIPECPLYQWLTQEWQGCIPRDGICGGGKEWRQVYCIKVGDTTKQPVEEKHCLQTDKKPLSRRACWRDCPVDCQLGEWENWSPCSRSCGDGGFHVRMREVLRPPAHGGQPCDAQYQTKECEPVECAWWRTDSWSTCFLDSRDSACGRGLWYRVVYCISALDAEVDSSNCEGITKPLPSDQCSVPCPEDCIVSEWSKWSPCSVTCGKQGGMQTRWREILAYGADSEDCLREDQLVQTNVCNLHVSCDAYIWQISPWEECTSMESVDACGDDVGVQKRNVTCEIDSGVAANETLCSSSEKPDTHQSCSIPCPVDCVVSQWSDWSGCNQTCGHEAHQERSRVILLLEANGGIPCPEGAKEEGVLLESRACDGVPPCYSYQWLTGNWSHCLVARDQCGQGLRDRQVSCERNDGTIVDPGFCVREIFGPVPLTHEQCYVACGGDCELSDWTPYGPCEHDCEPLDHVGYCRRRSRELLVDHPEDIFALCPHLSADELLEVIPCTSETHNYTANIGPWSDCILDGECGQGKRLRSVTCLREDGQMVPIGFCQLEDLVEGEEDCSVECPQDCTVSSWLSWSSCSARCGTGVKVRQRETVIDNSAGGKVCPHLSESVPCRLASCVDFVWTVGDWSPCYLTNTSSNCGPGLRNRTVACPAGEEFGADCAHRNPKPPIVTPCELPCVGDCVVSEWSEFTPCSSDCDPVGYKNRSRTVIRDPAENGQPCGDLSEVVDCDVESCQASKHRLETSVWTECQPHHGDCGPGVQWQVISCMNEVTGLHVSVDWCNQSHEVQEQACFIHCPIDCEYGSLSQWSPCTHHCGIEGVQTRSRQLLTEAKYGGRTCVRQLNQTGPCNIKPCFTYQWLKEPWGACLFDSFTGCGVGVETRRVECLRSDGLSVALEFCILPEDAAIRLSNDVVRELNMSSLDVLSSRTCEKPCPGDCVVSDWSEFSSCFGSCFDSSIPGNQTRSRHIVAMPSPDGFQCPKDTVESKPCNSKHCPEFSWMSGPWNMEEGVRDVWCQMKGSSVSNVTGGCIEGKRPPSSQRCRDPRCADHGSVCDAGYCKCQEGFEGDGLVCYPLEGCRDNTDCLEVLEETYCAKGGVCRCERTYDLREGTCRVPYARRHTNKTWVWFVIAGCCLVALLILIAAIYCVSRAEKGGFEPLSQNGAEGGPLPADNDPEFIKMSMLENQLGDS